MQGCKDLAIQKANFRYKSGAAHRLFSGDCSTRYVRLWGQKENRVNRKLSSSDMQG
jgi:hypothetical protein